MSGARVKINGANGEIEGMAVSPRSTVMHSFGIKGDAPPNLTSRSAQVPVIFPSRSKNIQREAGSVRSLSGEPARRLPSPSVYSQVFCA